MSGGHFDYAQHHIKDIASEIKCILEDNKYECDFNDETIKRLKEAVSLLELAYVYAHRIDWLISGDDSEDTFHERLKKEVEKLKEQGVNDDQT